MIRHFVAMAMVFVIGLLSGILLEAQIFNPIRVADAITAEQDDGAVTALESAADRAPENSTVASTEPAPVIPAGASPRLVVDQASYNFGEAEQGDRISHTFVLQNTGEAPLVISRVQPSCGCTVARLTKQSIDPGESAQIDTTLDLHNLAGPQNRLVMVQSNDPKTPIFRLAIVGTSNSRVIREPAVLMLGRVNPRVEAKGTVDITTANDLRLKVTDFKSSDDTLSPVIEEVTPGQHYRVAVSLTPQENGFYQGWVRLLTDRTDTYREIMVPVRAQVGEGGGVFQGDTLDISGPTLDGKEVDVRSYKGNPVVVVFWASWCGHCQQEVPSLITLHKKYEANGLRVIGVNVDRDAEKAITARNKWAVPWSDIHFPKVEGKTSDPLSERYQISGIPAIFLLDREGRVVATDARGAKLDDAISHLVQPPKVAVRN